ncbi:hypothetical protein [Paraburkholderia diazotrophica]|uniref:Uncharacterized protein n=1 Tax=Paraburkholderia diazotrophica TaxID=667676 RepID=A0A1H7CUS1_9BURK|nr:hypothetical protein [Paraburkholderia diazotrophica]SEJ90932.1 hypothetical protein SAMN05192539_102315 [Paraburkholderia diazotrophica]
MNFLNPHLQSTIPKRLNSPIETLAYDEMSFSCPVQLSLMNAVNAAAQVVFGINAGK